MKRLILRQKGIGMKTIFVKIATKKVVLIILQITVVCAKIEVLKLAPVMTHCKLELLLKR